MLSSSLVRRSAQLARAGAFYRAARTTAPSAWSRRSLASKSNKPSQQPPPKSQENSHSTKPIVNPPPPPSPQSPPSPSASLSSSSTSKSPSAAKTPTTPQRAKSSSSNTKNNQQPSPAKSETQPPHDDESPVPDLSKLPDLTQGIPSTLAYEMAGATNRSSLTVTEQAPGEEADFAEGGRDGKGGRIKGELPASAYILSSEKRRQKLANRIYALMAFSMLGGIVYLGREWDEEEARKHADIPNGWAPGALWNRAMTRLITVLTYYREPAFEKLLPDSDPMFSRPYTLCLSLEDMLVHSEWTREHGWRISKRPGLDYFLRYLSLYYEIVLFTTVPYGIADPLVRKLDPFHFIMWPLYREATRYKDGEPIKDLSYLNRDLSKVIVIDTNSRHVNAQPENAIILPKWTGDKADKELVALIPFLEYIYTMQYGDVRKVLKSFAGKHIPSEFARREAIARAEFNKQQALQKNKSPLGGMGSAMGALGGALGLKPSNMKLMGQVPGEEDTVEAFAKGKMLQDIARERGQRNYMLLEKEIRENGENWLKEEAEMQAKGQAEAMNSLKDSVFGWFRLPGTSPQNESGRTSLDGPPPSKA